MGNYAYGHASEFAYGWHGTCGQVSLAQAVQAARRGDVSTAAIQALMNDITHDMQSRGWAAANGAATLWGLARAAEVHGAAIEYEHDYQEPLPIDVRTVLQQNAGVRPIVLQVANGQALRDAVTGAADEQGLHYHAIAVLDKEPRGYICADGDNPQANERNQIYTWDTLAAAIPCGILILNMAAVPVPVPPDPVPVPATNHVPDGWQWDGTQLHAPGTTDVVVLGFAQHILSSTWDASVIPAELEHVFQWSGDTITRQRFLHGHVLYYSVNMAKLWEGDTTDEWMKAEIQMNEARAALAALQAAPVDTKSHTAIAQFLDALAALQAAR